MTEWIDTSLAEICASISYGYTASAKWDGEGPKFLRITDIVPDRLLWENVPTCEITEKNFDKYRLEEGDIVIARTGATTGYNRIIKDSVDAVYASYLIRYQIDKDKADPFFIGHVLQSNNWFDYVDAIMGGSAQPGANAKQFGEYEILLPPLPEQNAIAEVLSSLDDKIDLLHRQNQKLEELAEVLFRKWFIEEADEDWELGKIPDEFDFVMGSSPPGSSYNEIGEGTPMYQGNADFGFRFPTNRVFTTDPKRFAEKFDTLISVRAPVGEQNMADEKCCIGRGVAAFRLKNDPSNFSYTYYKLKSIMDDIKQFNQAGTVFGSISKGDFEELEIVVPPSALIERFSTFAKPLDQKVHANYVQILKLEKLRNTLLPKLMSGEVRVKN